MLSSSCNWWLKRRNRCKVLCNSSGSVFLLFSLRAFNTLIISRIELQFYASCIFRNHGYIQILLIFFKFCPMPIAIGVPYHVFKEKGVCLNFMFLFFATLWAKMYFLFIVFVFAIEILIIFIKWMLAALAWIFVRRRKEKLDVVFVLLLQQESHRWWLTAHIDAQVNWYFICLKMDFSLNSVFKSHIYVSFALD